MWKDLQLQSINNIYKENKQYLLLNFTSHAYNPHKGQ